MAPAHLVVIEAQIIPQLAADQNARLLEDAAHGLPRSGTGNVEPQRTVKSAAAQEFCHRLLSCSRDSAVGRNGQGVRAVVLSGTSFTQYTGNHRPSRKE
jgi:hypothetical protein